MNGPAERPGARPRPDGPLGTAEAADRFSILSSVDALLIAVSGGSDSMAMLGLLARWRAGLSDGPRLVAATVDHGLRPGGSHEAALVSDTAERLGIVHHILKWDGAKPRTGLPEAARQARYHLLDTLGEQIGAPHLVTAHHLDDQAETVLMRLAAGSGLAGAAGMAARTTRGGIVHHRPLLAVPRSRLRATCAALGLPFADDPTNTDAAYSRARWRALAPHLAAEGLDAARLAAFAERAGRAEAALAEQAQALVRRTAVAGGWNTSAWAREPFEIARRALALVLPAEGGDGHPVRLERLERLTQALREAALSGAALRRTFAGQVLSLDRAGVLTVAGEGTRKRGRSAAAPVHRDAGFPLATGRLIHTLPEAEARDPSKGTG